MFLLRKSRLGVIAVIVLLTAVAPYEVQLGNVAKLIYLHAAMIWAGFVLVGAVAVTALLSLWRPRLYCWARALLKTALIYMTFNVIFVPIITKLSWGIFFAWQEPRVFITFFLFAFTLGVALLVDTVGSSRTGALVLTLPGISLAALMVNAGRALHPVDPIGESGSVAIKLVTAALLVAVLVLAALWTSDIHNQPEHRLTEDSAT